MTAARIHDLAREAPTLSHAYPMSRQRPAWAPAARFLVECCALAFFVVVLAVGFIAGGM